MSQSFGRGKRGADRQRRELSLSVSPRNPCHEMLVALPHHCPRSSCSITCLSHAQTLAIFWFERVISFYAFNCSLVVLILVFQHVVYLFCLRLPSVLLSMQHCHRIPISG